MNEKIRHQGLSAKEIMFSRDQFTKENLKISDEVLAEEKMEIRKKENVYSAKAKASNMEQIVQKENYFRGGQGKFLQKGTFFRGGHGEFLQKSSYLGGSR